MRRHLLTTIALSCLLASGCNAERDEVGTARAAPAAHLDKAIRDIRPGELKLPDRLRFSAVDRVRVAQSWEERLSTLTVAQQARLESLNVRYYGSLEFDSPEEQRKLVEAGFPMPEEWLAAEEMSDGELATLAKAQNPKGALFYANRELDRFIETKQQLLDAGAFNDLDKSVMHPKVEAMVYASNALALTRSPFAAYLYGSVNANMFGDPEYTAAAISVAWSLGDSRASDFAKAFSGQLRASNSPPLTLEGLASAESLMWRQVHRYRPL
jgi:hypothetical protein